MIVPVPPHVSGVYSTDLSLNSTEMIGVTNVCSSAGKYSPCTSI